MTLHGAVGVGLFGGLAAAWVLKTGALQRTVPKAIRPVIVAYALILSFAAAGGAQATYGSVGSLGVTLELSSTAVAFDTNSTFEAWINVTNTGTTTVRWYPYPVFHLLTPGGIEMEDRYRCPVACAGRFWGIDDDDLTELSPGEFMEWHLTLHFRGGADRQCGEFNFSGPGTYVAFVDIAPVPSPRYVTLPFWSGAARSAPVNLLVS